MQRSDEDQTLVLPSLARERWRHFSTTKEKRGSVPDHDSGQSQRG